MPLPAVTESYDQGETAAILDTVTSTDSGALVDPATVYFVVLKPDQVTYVRYNSVSNPGFVIRLSQGKYIVYLPLDQAGPWTGRMYATSGQPGAHSSPFVLHVAPDALV